MHVVRGRTGDPAVDREWTVRLLAAAADGEPGLRVWVPHRQVAFGRRDQRQQGYERARSAARQRGFEPYERRVGGRAVAFDGELIVGVVRTWSGTGRGSIGDRYDRVLEQVVAALESLDVAVERGEPSAAFCPGSCSLSSEGGKIVGLAQRVTAEAAMVAGVCIVDVSQPMLACLEAVYGALDLPFARASVGSIADAGGPSEPAAVCEAIETTLGGDPSRVTNLS